MKLSWLDQIPQENLLETVVCEHTTIPLYENAKSASFKSASARNHYGKNIGSLAYDYLLNTLNKAFDPETQSSINDYASDANVMLLSLIAKRAENFTSFIPLPESVDLKQSLSDVIKLRRSCRYFTGKSAQLDQVATLLRAAYGKTFDLNVKVFDECILNFPMRSVPSCGSLYPLEIYLVVNHINDIKRGAYHYNSEHDALVNVANGDSVETILSAFKVTSDQLTLAKSSGVILIAARPSRTLEKYGDRGLRYIFQEGGSVSQNIHLAATSLGLGSVDCCRMYESLIHNVLNIDGKNTLLIHSIVFGQKDPDHLGGMQ